MNSTNVNVRGLFLKKQPYREYDALATYLMEDIGLFTLVIKGIYKEKSRNKVWVLPFVDYDLTFKKGDKRIANAINVSANHHFLNLAGNIPLSIYGTFVLEIAQYEHIQPSYQLVKEVLTYLDAKQYQPLVILACLMAQLLAKHGLLPQVDYAINTQQKKVNTFSIKEGGFLFLAEAPIAFSVEQLQHLRYIYKAGIKHLKALDALTISDDLFKLMLDYFEYHFDVQLKSKSLLFLEK